VVDALKMSSLHTLLMYEYFSGAMVMRCLGILYNSDQYERENPRSLRSEEDVVIKSKLYPREKNDGGCGHGCSCAKASRGTARELTLGFSIVIHFGHAHLAVNLQKRARRKILSAFGYRSLIKAICNTAMLHLHVLDISRYMSRLKL
jgi:hypothetical protein